MKAEKILRLLDRQDEEILKKMKNELPVLIENEFIMTNVLKSYMEYMRKSSSFDYSTVSGSLPQNFSRRDVLIKKADGFHISRHISELPMYLHRHTYIEMDYVYKGSCTCTIENEGNVFELHEKEMCIVNQNIIHGVSVKSREDIIFKCFVPLPSIDMSRYENRQLNPALQTFLKNSLYDNSLYSAYAVIDTAPDETVDELIFYILSESLEQLPGCEQQIQNYLSALLLELMRVDAQNCRVISETITDDAIVARIIRCIQKNYQYITLKDLAKDFHFHENYLSRKIKRSTDKSFSELLQGFRLQDAEELLLNTNLSVGEISVRIGYSKPSYLYKLFKDHYGMTPTEYRNSNVGA